MMTHLSDRSEGLPMDEKHKLKQLTLRLPENLHRKFKLSTVKNGKTMGEVATELIKAYLKNQYH